MRNANLHGYDSAVNCYDTTNRFIDILVFCDSDEIERVCECFDKGIIEYYMDDTCTICWGDAIVLALDERGVDCYIDFATLEDDGMIPDDEWDTLVDNVSASAKVFCRHCFGF